MRKGGKRIYFVQKRKKKTTKTKARNLEFVHRSKAVSEIMYQNKFAKLRCKSLDSDVVPFGLSHARGQILKLL